MQVEERARSAGVAGVPLHWRAFLLGPIFRAQGWNDSPFNLYPAKGRCMWRGLERRCAALDLPLVHPSRFPRNGLLAARVACWFEDVPWVPAFVRAVDSANFARDEQIADADIVAEAGADGAATLAGDELFWGHDRLDDALAWAAGGPSDAAS